MVHFAINSITEYTVLIQLSVLSLNNSNNSFVRQNFGVLNPITCYHSVLSNINSSLKHFKGSVKILKSMGTCVLPWLDVDV